MDCMNRRMGPYAQAVRTLSEANRYLFSSKMGLYPIRTVLPLMA